MLQEDWRLVSTQVYVTVHLINSHVHMHKWHNDVIIKYVEKIFLAEYSNMPPLPVKERQLYSLLRSSLWNSFLDHLSWKINRAFISCWTLSVCLFIMFYIGNQPNLTQKTLDETIFKLPTWMIEIQISKNHHFQFSHSYPLEQIR